MRSLVRMMSTLLTLALIVMAIPLAVFATEDGIMIDEEHFPDEGFRAFVLETYDSDGDLRISDAEAKAVNRMRVRKSGGQAIKSLTGIAFFPNLKDLACEYIGLEELDVSGNTRLEVLCCSENPITQLDLSKNTGIIAVQCYETPLSQINLTGCKKLERLDLLMSEDLEELDITDCPNLRQLIVSFSGLSVLDISKCPCLSKAYHSSKDNVDPSTVNAAFYYHEDGMTELDDFHLELDSSAEIIVASSNAPLLRKGDVNSDGDINATDYLTIKRSVLGSYDLSENECIIADVNRDGDVGAEDYLMVKRDVLGSYQIRGYV